MPALPSGQKLSGMSFPGVPGFSPADLSDFGLTVAALIGPQVTSAFDPRDARDVVTSTPVLTMYDKVRPAARWSAENGANNPTLQANSLFGGDTWATFPPATGFRSSLFSQHTDYSIFGLCYVSTNQLALAATRTLYSKDPGSGNSVSLYLAPGTNNLQLNTQGASGVEAHNTGVVPTVGVHAFAVSQKGTSLALFWDQATTPSVPYTVASTPAPISGRWTAGCLTNPTNASWDSQIGPLYFMDNAALHSGTSDLDNRRKMLFQAAADHYGVVLAN